MDVTKYIVGASKAGLTTLTPTRDWRGAKGRVITSLGAATVAAIAIRNQRPAAETILAVDGQEHPSYVIPTDLLGLDNIGYRVAKNGNAMAQRVAVQKAEARMNRAFSAVLKARGISF